MIDFDIVKNAINNGTFILASAELCVIYNEKRQKPSYDYIANNKKYNIRDIISYVKEYKSSDEYYRVSSERGIVANLKNMNKKFINVTVEFFRDEASFTAFGYRLHFPIKKLPDGFFNEYPEYLDVLKKDIEKRDKQLSEISTDFEFINLILPSLNDDQKLYLKI